MTDLPYRKSRRQVLRALGAGGLAGAVLTGTSESATASAADTVSPTLHSYYDVTNYGATGDGKTDDSHALQAAIDAAASAGGGVVYLPTGSYAVGTTLKITSSGVGIRGVGASSEILGTAAAGDIIYAGRSSTSARAVQNVFFEHFSIRAAVQKTSGAAIFCEFAERFRIVDVKAATQEAGGAANNLFDGFTFRYFDTCVLSNVNIAVAHTGLTMYGQADQSWGAGLWLNGGSRVLFCQTGIHIAGSSGGIAFEDTDIIANDTNVLIDDSGSGTTNRELFFDQCWIDSAKTIGVDIGANGVAVLHFNNTWIASSGATTQGHPEGANIHARSGGIDNPASVIVDGCRIFNGVGSGIVAESGAWTITGCDIEFNGRGQNGGYGILLANSSVSDVIINGNNIRNNGWPFGESPRPLGEGVHIITGVDNYVVTSNLLRHNGTGQLIDEGGPNRIVKDNLTK